MAPELPGLVAFTAARGSAFVLDLGAAGTVELVLVAVTPYTADGTLEDPGGERRSFSLIFRGPPEPQLAQATIPLRHATLGTMEIFVVPIGRDADGVRYEAVFG